jgi:hypothetical protein
LPSLFRNARTVGVALAIVLLVAGCNPPEEQPEAEATEQASPTDNATSEEPSPSPSPSPTALPAQFLQDSDGNLVPDFVEEELGYDPANDDCALRSCPGVEGLDPAASTSVEQNVLLVLDASGSMAGPAGNGQTKMEAARAALERYAYGLPPNYRLGLEVFGHRGSNEPAGKAESCAGIEVIAPLGGLTPDSAAGVLNQFQPTGYTPIAAALQHAAEAFAGTEGAGNRVILVTDGIETCEGDPVAAAMALKQAGIAVTVDVVGFDVEGEADREALRRIAESTGGAYTDAPDAAGLEAFIDEQLATAAALADQYSCISSSVNEAQTCSSDLRSRAQDFVSQIAIREENRALQLLIFDLVDRIIERDRIEFDRREEFRQTSWEEYQRRFLEVRQRYRERYGEDVAAGPLCMDRLIA